jgi:hypothetical protein
VNAPALKSQPIGVDEIDWDAFEHHLRQRYSPSRVKRDLVDNLVPITPGADSPHDFFSGLNWIDGTPLPKVIEPYRMRIFNETLYSVDGTGRQRYNLVLCGRAKKNWKSTDLVLAAMYKLLAYESKWGNQVYILANDGEQAGDDLEIARKFIEVNPDIAAQVSVLKHKIQRVDGKGFMEILPAKDVAGAHGKTYCFCGFDEIHGYKNWDLLEAMQLDPTRPDTMQWLTSYASIHHKPGVPLFDLFAKGKKAEDSRMFFSWYAADYTTDPTVESLPGELKANPSCGLWSDADYLEQQKRRLPAHKYRRLHLNLPGLPEGAAYNADVIMSSIATGTSFRAFDPNIKYQAFVDMSGGSNDDATLAIAHKDYSGRSIIDVCVNQGQPPPFDPRMAVERFVRLLREYQCMSVTGDKFAGETFINDFGRHGIGYHVSELSKHELYESFEPWLNSDKVVLLDNSECESQLLGLMWRGNKIDHNPSEHDDFANSVVGVTYRLLNGSGGFRIGDIQLVGERLQLDW